MAEHTSEYAKALGARLRAARNRSGLSARGVEIKSGGRFSAAAISSYERGDRAVTVQKLAALADFYGVPIFALIPPNRCASGPDEAAALVAGILAEQGLVVARSCGCGEPLGTCACGQARCWRCDPAVDVCGHSSGDAR